MDTKKITDLCFLIRSKESIIYELYRIIGANGQLDFTTRSELYAIIEDHKKDLEKLSIKLKKHIT